MIVHVDIGGSDRTLDVRSVGRQFEVVLEGRRLVADLVQTGSTYSMLIGEPLAGSSTDSASGVGRPMASFELAIEHHADRSSTVMIGGQAMAVSVGAGAGRFGRDRTSDGSRSTGPSAVVAPMPGRIVEILVAVGDPVVAGQGLVVVEAMKMENELRAPRDGTVTEVRVSRGASVEARSVLVVIE